MIRPDCRTKPRQATMEKIANPFERSSARRKRRPIFTQSRVDTAEPTLPSRGLNRLPIFRRRDSSSGSGKRHSGQDKLHQLLATVQYLKKAQPLSQHSLQILERVLQEVLLLPGWDSAQLIPDIQKLKQRNPMPLLPKEGRHRAQEQELKEQLAQILEVRERLGLDVYVSALAVWRRLRQKSKELNQQLIKEAIFSLANLSEPVTNPV